MGGLSIWHWMIALLVILMLFGGGIAWAFGEVPTLLVLIALAVQWSRSDDREAARHDRKAERDGDAELTAYNEQLAMMNRRND